MHEHDEHERETINPSANGQPGPEILGSSWRDFRFHNPEILKSLFFTIPPINALKTFDEENKNKEQVRQTAQTGLNEEGQKIEDGLKGKEKRQYKTALNQTSSLKKKIAGAEKGSKQEQELKNKFDESNQKLIDIYNSKQTNENSKITTDKLKEKESLGLNYWNISIPYSQRGKAKENPGFDLSRKIILQYMGEEALTLDEKLEDLSLEDKRLLLKYYLSSESLKEDDKDLLLRFIRKHILDRDRDDINGIFGYKTDEVDPDKYLKLMTDPELMTEEDRKENKAKEKGRWRKQMRQERRAARKETNQDFRSKRKEINDQDDLSGKKKREQRQANRQERRTERHARHKAASDDRLEDSLSSHFMQLDRVNDEVSSKLGIIKKEHETIEQEKKDAGILNQVDELAPNHRKWALIIFDILDEMGNTTSDDFTSWDPKQQEKKGLDLQELFQIYPPEYNFLYDKQKKIESATSTELPGLYWEVYQEVYANNPAAQTLIGGPYPDQTALSSAILAKPELASALMTGTINHKYLDASKLKDPDGVYYELLGEFGKAALVAGLKHTELERVLKYFQKRYIEPYMVPIAITGGAAWLGTFLLGLGTKDFTGMGVADMAPLDLKGDFYKRKFGKSTETFSWFLNNKHNALGMPSSAPLFGNFGKTPSLSVNAGFRYSDVEKEGNQLRQQMLIQGMLMIDTILGNANVNPTTGQKDFNAIGQLDYIRKNITSLSIDEMKELLSDPTTFMNAAKIQAPDKTMWDFRGALNAKYATKNISVSGTAVGGIYDVGGDTKFSFATMGHVTGNWNITPGAKIKFDTDLRAAFMTGQTPTFQFGASATYMQKVRIHETNFGYYLTLGGAASNKKPEELYIKGGMTFPIGQKYSLGTEVELHYDIDGNFTIWNRYLGARIFLNF